MQIEVLRKPIYALIIRDFFDKKTNELILLEAQNLSFETATINKGADLAFRSNKVCYYDNLYPTEKSRKQSMLLNALDERFKTDGQFRETLFSCPYPISEFCMTNYHETQVSNYNGGQKYKWHIDRMSNNARVISLVYWFFKEPKKFTGGNLGLTDSPIYDGYPVKENQKEHYLEIEPENNMAVIFSATTPHCVLPTNCKDEEYSRYSANVWIGII